MQWGIENVRYLFRFTSDAEKSDDDELVLQIIFTLFKFLLHRETREAILQNEGVIVSLLELLHAPHPILRHTVNDALEVIVECGEIYQEKVVEKRFEHHNREWLQLMHEMATGAVNDPYYAELQMQQMQMQNLHAHLAGGGSLPHSPAGAPSSWEQRKYDFSDDDSGDMGR